MTKTPFNLPATLWYPCWAVCLLALSALAWVWAAWSAEASPVFRSLASERATADPRETPSPESPVPGPECPAPSPPSSPRLALLVGIDIYAKLGPARQLDGCRNDVEQMRALLVKRFGFRPGDVVTLLDGQATAASIRDALGRLAERTNAFPADAAAAQVVFYFSGHGSQVRDQEEGDDCDEEDGLDETLVPYDAEVQGGDQDIRDDELYRFAEAVCHAGRARLWIVLDCCHAGTGVRGATKVRQLRRNIAPLALPAGSARPIRPKRLPDSAVLLAACRAEEVEPEYREGDRSFGLLTRFLIQVLEETTQVSGLSYGMLRDMVLDRYGRGGVVPAPTPQLEGTPEALRSVVLGAGTLSDRKPYFQAKPLAPDRRTVEIDAGAFHGLTAGSLFELYERPEQVALCAGPALCEGPPTPQSPFGEVGRPAPSAGGQAPAASLAWLQIERVDAVRSIARPFRWADAAQGSQVEIALPRDFTLGYAVERYHQHSQPGARVRVVRAVAPGADGPPLGPSDPELPSVVRDALVLTRGPGESPWLEWVEGESPCDLLLRIDGPWAALFPATGMSIGVPRGPTVRGEASFDSLRGGWGPIDLRQIATARRQLEDHLRRIVRARNLIRVASQTPGPGARPVELELMAVKLNRDLEIESAEPWPLGHEQARVVRKDDLFALRVVHKGATRKPVYVTVLAIDPDMEIQAVLPHQQGLGLTDPQRLEPGAMKMSSPYQCTEPYGPHYAILLVTEEPSDFSMLVQRALPRVRAAASGSPLEELLWEQMYFQTRGTRRPQAQKPADGLWWAAILRWDAAP